MDLIELIKKRQSVRAFKKEMPPRQDILDCLEAATWSPNQSNQQPWKFIVLENDKLTTVARAIEQNFAESFQKRDNPSQPPTMGTDADVLAGRKKRTYQILDKFCSNNRVNIREIGDSAFAFYNAPVGIIFATYPAKGLNFYKSTTAAMESFILAATAKGLGTCWINTVSICQEYIKQTLNLPEELILVDGVAVGYPDEDAPINQLPRERLPIDQVMDWPPE